jgi:hypothetical protein
MPKTDVVKRYFKSSNINNIYTDKFFETANIQTVVYMPLYLRLDYRKQLHGVNLVKMKQ